MSHDAELVELFEYKVADVLEGRLPKGGKRSVSDLREYLLSSPHLDGAMLRRLRAAERALRSYQAAQSAALPWEASGQAPFAAETARPASAAPTLNPQWPASAASQERNEWEVLSQLRGALFQVDVRERAYEQVKLWLREPTLTTLRLAYALRAALHPAEAVSAASSAFSALLGDEVPSDDAPSTLSRPGVSAALLTALIGGLCLPGREAQGRYPDVRGALRALSSNDLSAALSERERAPSAEPLSSQAISQALHTALRGLKETRRTHPQLRSAAGRLLTFLESVVPRSLGGQGHEWPLLEGLLFAQSQVLRLVLPPEHALSLAIHLPGGDATFWRSEQLHWQRLKPGQWQLRLINAPLGRSHEVTLSAEQPVAHVELGDHPARLVLLGDDLALELRPHSHQDLWSLVLEAKLVAALLEPGQAYANLRLARAAAQRLHGDEIRLEKVSASSAERYASAPPETLLSFARQGAQTLLTFAAQGNNEQLGSSFAEARTFLNLSRHQSEALLQLVRRSVHAEELSLVESGAEVVSGEHYALLQFRGEPVTVRVAQRPLTLRSDYKGELCAVMVGASAAPVRDLLVIALPQGGITVVRAGERVVVGFQDALLPPGGGYLPAD